MKLLVSYNVFDGEELLEGSIRQIRDQVDEVICVVQCVSNFGEQYFKGVDECNRLAGVGLVDHLPMFHPNKHITPLLNETEKRNVPIKYAQENGFTHVLNMDVDEYFTPEGFANLKKYVENTDYDWYIIPITTYFKSPTLTVGMDKTYMPFMAKVTPELQCGRFPCSYLCDPTRKFNGEYHKILTGDSMHHYSWVRKDIMRKVNNSTARDNILNSSLLQDFESAKEGYYLEHWGKKLTLAENIFDIRDYSTELSKASKQD